MGASRPPLSNGKLDRDAVTRMAPERLSAAWAEHGARLLRMRGIEVPVVESPDGSLHLSLQPVTGSYEPIREEGRLGCAYLGRLEGAPVFGAAVADETDDLAVAAAPGAATGPAAAVASGIASGAAGPERWVHPFEVGHRLDDTERELIAVISALLRWHEAAEFSPRDGGRTVPALGGWARLDEHGGEHFPRTDPAVIVLVEHEDRVLLGSNALWETGRFSLLAGFVEAGESLEQTVEREIFEEAGVRLGEMRYVTSQPWPFPRSLMFGFRAKLAEGADPEELRPDPEEISELRWFTRDELRDPLPGLRLPMPLSIARWMIDQWLEEGDRHDARG